MASTYTKFTDEQREMARRTSISDILHANGETVRKSGSEYLWIHGDSKITIRGNLWYHHYEGIGGDAISFVQRFLGKSYPQAMEYLLGTTESTPFQKAEPKPKKESTGTFELPKASVSMLRVYGYLMNRRGIPKDIINTFVRQKMIYESENYHNAVFVGYDKDDNPRHANMRATGFQSGFRGNAPNSSPEHSFHWYGTSPTLYVFESPIDMMSFIALYPTHWQSQNYCACCGVGDRVVDQMRRDNPTITKVVLCLDNDAPGKKATRRIEERLRAEGVTTSVLVPEHKDWNEDLLAKLQPSEVSTCQESQSL